MYNNIYTCSYIYMYLVIILLYIIHSFLLLPPKLPNCWYKSGNQHASSRVKKKGHAAFEVRYTLSEVKKGQIEIESKKRAPSQCRGIAVNSDTSIQSLSRGAWLLFVLLIAWSPKARWCMFSASRAQRNWGRGRGGICLQPLSREQRQQENLGPLHQCVP